MLEWLNSVFSTDGFPARWNCGTAWGEQPGWGWLYIISDILIWAAYMAIPLVLVYFVRKRTDVPFPKIFWLFSGFIFFCGTTHILDAAMFWWPAYRFSAVLKLATALVSWTTVIALLPTLPRAIHLPSSILLEQEVNARTKELLELNKKLQAEIATRNRVQNDFFSNQEKLALALDAGRMGVWEWDLDTNETKFDPYELKLWGYSIDRQTVPIAEVFDRILPDDRERVRASTDNTIKTQERYHAEFRIQHPELGIRWIEGCGKVLCNERGEPIRMIGLNWDITERQLADEHLRLNNRALEAATNGIIITDANVPNCKIAFVNRGFEQLTGYRAAEILGKDCRFLQGPATDPRDISKIREAIATRQDCHITLLNYRRDGSTFWNELRISPIENEQGEVTHFVGIQNDITNRMESEKSLRNAQELAESANRSKSDFLANMSHEIRTPLTVVLGCAETLYPHLTNDEKRGMVQMIRNQGELLLGILNDVLDFSKIEAGKLEIISQSCSIVNIVEDVKSLFASQAVDKGLELKAEYPEKLPKTIISDGLRIRQILINLVGNSLKFTDKGSVAIKIGLVQEEKQNFVKIQVSDTGMGVPPEKLHDIFTAFHQEHRHLSQKYGGTGLGLTICQRLIELLHGRIEVASSVGVGTTIAFFLPIAPNEITHQVPVDALIRAQHEQELIHESLRVSLTMQILLVEDTRGIQFLIKRMLEDMKATVTIVSNGQEALDLMSKYTPGKEPFDLILMDMQMPIMNGFDATARLREQGYNVPIIALTAAALQGDRERCLAVGCNDYLPKPIDRQQLFLLLANYYEQTQDQQHS